jgi:hypothetical protein
MEMGMRLWTGFKWPEICLKFGVLMSILVIKVDENLLTNPTIGQSTSQDDFFPEVLHLRT